MEQLEGSVPGSAGKPHTAEGRDSVCPAPSSASTTSSELSFLSEFTVPSRRKSKENARLMQQLTDFFPNGSSTSTPQKCSGSPTPKIRSGSSTPQRQNGSQTSQMRSGSQTWHDMIWP